MCRPRNVEVAASGTLAVVGQAEVAASDTLAAVGPAEVAASDTLAVVGQAEVAASDTLAVVGQAEVAASGTLGRCRPSRGARSFTRVNRYPLDLHAKLSLPPVAIIDPDQPVVLPHHLRNAASAHLRVHLSRCSCFSGNATRAIRRDPVLNKLHISPRLTCCDQTGRRYSPRLTWGDQTGRR